MSEQVVVGKDIFAVLSSSRFQLAPQWLKRSVLPLRFYELHGVSEGVLHPPQMGGESTAQLRHVQRKVVIRRASGGGYCCRGLRPVPGWSSVPEAAVVKPLVQVSARAASVLAAAAETWARASARAPALVEASAPSVGPVPSLSTRPGYFHHAACDWRPVWRPSVIWGSSGRGHNRWGCPQAGRVSCDAGYDKARLLDAGVLDCGRGCFVPAWCSLFLARCFRRLQQEASKGHRQLFVHAGALVRTGAP